MAVLGFLRGLAQSLVDVGVSSNSLNVASSYLVEHVVQSSSPGIEAGASQSVESTCCVRKSASPAPHTPLPTPSRPPGLRTSLNPELKFFF